MKSWQNARPAGLKLDAATMFAEDGLTRDDFAEVAAVGIRRLKFQRPISRRADAENYRQWAHDNGMRVLIHTGNRSLIKDVEEIGESFRVIRPDVASHINGGPTPAPWTDIEWLITQSAATLELCFIGNMPIAVRVLRMALERGEPHRLAIGSDLPGGTGVVRNTTRAFGHRGGRVALGEPADLVAWDPVEGSAADTFVDCVTYGDRAYPGLVMIDGVIEQHGNPLLLDPKRPPFVKRKDDAAVQSAVVA